MFQKRTKEVFLARRAFAHENQLAVNGNSRFPFLNMFSGFVELEKQFRYFLVIDYVGFIYVSYNFIDLLRTTVPQFRRK